MLNFTPAYCTRLVYVQSCFGRAYVFDADAVVSGSWNKEKKMMEPLRSESSSCGCSVYRRGKPQDTSSCTSPAHKGPAVLQRLPFLESFAARQTAAIVAVGLRGAYPPASLEVPLRVERINFRVVNLRLEWRYLLLVRSLVL